MKHIWKYCLTAFVLFGAAACSKDDPPPSNEGGKMSIRIAGDPASQDSRHVATEFTNENVVSAYFIGVYDYNTGTVEKFVVGNPGHVTLIEGLSTASTKRVFVLANYPIPVSAYPNTAITWSSVYDYVGLRDLSFASYIFWNPENTSNYGLVMVGEADGAITLSGSETTEVTVHLKRAVAKVTLGTVTLSNSEGLDPAKFTLKSVSIQRQYDKTTLRLDDYSFYADPSNQTFLGGFAGSLSVRGIDADGILDEISLPSHVANVAYPFGNYFYVVRNNGMISPTLICLEAEYDGKTYYYPVVINPPAGGNTTGSTGQYIESNHQYRINITIKDPIGSNDPDTPINSADLEVTIVVDPWELEIVQNSEI